MNITAPLMQALADPIRRLRGVDDFVRDCAQALGRQIGATSIVFTERSVPDRQPRAMHFCGWPAHSAQHYLREHWQHDPLRGWLAAVAGGAAADVTSLSQLVDDRELTRAPFYRNLLQPAGARHVLTVALRTGTGRGPGSSPDTGAHDAGPAGDRSGGARIGGVLSLLRPAQAGDFGDAERSLVHTLAPLLALAYDTARERAAVAACTGVGGCARCAVRPGHAGLHTLTPRERDVLQHLLRGLPNKLIARELGVSPFTVKNLLRGVFRKLAVQSRAQLVARHAAQAPLAISASAACSPDQCDCPTVLLVR